LKTGDTGHHQAIQIEDKVYDNMNPNGISFKEWYDDMGGDSYFKKFGELTLNAKFF